MQVFLRVVKCGHHVVNLYLTVFRGSESRISANVQCCDLIDINKSVFTNIFKINGHSFHKHNKSHSTKDPILMPLVFHYITLNITVFSQNDVQIYATVLGLCSWM